MKIICTENYDRMSRYAANIISAQVIIKPDCVLGLATGSTPLGVYKQLVRWYEKGDIDFSKVNTVNLDEYYGISEENSQSYAYFMRQNLFNHINIDLNHTNIPNGMAENPEEECQRYNKVINDLGGIDLQLLGVGHNGHIGFNEPGEAFEKETHFVMLSQRTVDANARFFDNIDDVPKRAITMGIKSIMNARKILFIASGEDKADIIYQVVTGRIEPSVPATILQLHNDVTIVADKGALSKIIKYKKELIYNCDMI